MIRLLILFSLLGLKTPPIPTLYLSEVIITEEFSKEALWAYILEKEIRHPEIVYAQAVLETGNFTSRIFRENHNLFGMKLPKIRPTVATGERYGHATYCHWKDSVDDYLLWQEMWSNIETETVYYTLLQRVYAEDRNYTRLVKTIRKQNYEWNI